MTSTTDTVLSHNIVTLFAAGAIAVLVFHQGAWTILHLMGVTGAPFPTEPSKPFGVPEIWSLVLWGGVWGIVFGIAARWFPSGGLYWVAAFLFGAILPTLVFMAVVAPLKGIALGWDPVRLAVGPIVNGAWGLGTAILLWWRG